MSDRAVLLVEDDPHVREGMEEILSTYAAVTSASNVSEAFQAMERQSYSLVIADLRIGGDGNGGRRVVNRARELKIKTAIISAATRPEIDAALGEDVPDAVLTKPFLIEELEGIARWFLRP